MTGAAPYYITTPIYYVNDAPHIGHAYTTVACDALARFMRLDGRRVKFLTGTDEHGQKVEKSARAAGHRRRRNSPTGCPRSSATMTRLLDISNDDFIRTTEPRHIRARRRRSGASSERRGEIYLGRFAGWYAVRDEAFYDESELVDGKGRRPAPRSNGSRRRIISSACPPGRTGCSVLRGESRCDRAARRPQRGDQLRQRRAEGSVDLAHQLHLGHAGPGRSQARHVCLARRADQLHHRPRLSRRRKRRFSTFWPADLHMVGKDILRFHAVYWPAFLMAAGLAPPRRVFAHGWWTVEGEKMSKSLGNVIPPQQLVDTYGVDPVRYFLLRELPFGSDGDFSHRAVVGRLNGDLANDLGNLAQRVLVMINRDCARGGARARRAHRGRRGAARPAQRTACETVRSHMQPSRPSTWRSRRSGRSSPRPIAMSTSRRRGRCGADRSGADGHGALYAGRDDPASRDPGAAVGAQAAANAARPARGAGRRRAISPRLRQRR